MNCPPIGVLNSLGYFPYKPLNRSSFLGGDPYGDLRLSRRLRSLKERIVSTQSVVIQQISRTRSEREAWYRLLKNSKLSPCLMLDDLIESTLGDYSDRAIDHVLLVEDTSIFNYNKSKGKLKDPDSLGGTYSYANKHYGYLLHLSLGVDAANQTPLGICDVQMWHKSSDLANYKDRKGGSIPISSKSSYRWIDGAISGAARFNKAKRKTVLADREADIYEAFCEITQQGVDLIIRSQHDRNIVEGPGKLRAYLSSQDLGGRSKLVVKEDLRSNQIGRTAHLELRFAQLTLKRSHKAASSEIGKWPKEFPLYALEAKEINPPDGAKSIDWILLSTHPINSAKEAIQVIQWYKQRWHIEQLFRLMKNQGLRLEELDYQYGQNIQKMGIIGIEAALRILQLNLAYKTEEPIQTTLLFNDLQIKVLEILLKQYEGKTRKQKNPYPKEQLKWACWIIARMGGWKGYATKARPGPITFKRGWVKFREQFEMFNILNSE